MKKAISVILVLFLIGSIFVGCESKVKIDYENTADFENALNAGEDLTGKTVRFTVNELIPNSAFGYNLLAGEHLNFCSAENPGAKKGDAVVAKATEIQSMLGSFIIKYELVEVIAGSEDAQEENTDTEATEAKATNADTTESVQDVTESTVTPDYLNVEDFEAALNDGKDLAGKTVTFTVTTLVPDSAFGYNLQTGEHLNFCSSTHPGVKEGDTLTVKVTEIQSVLGSYIIYYEIV